MAKTKSNPQSDTTKPPKTQHDIPNHTTDDAASSDKLHNLKSLNAMLLKETVERRQQVDSLTQVNMNLESELNKCVSDKNLLQSEFNLLSERAVELEIEKGVASRCVEQQVSEMTEFRVSMVEKVNGLERVLERVIGEKNTIERVKNEKESEIGCLNSRLSKLEGEIGEEKFILSRVSEERDALRAQIEDRIRIENGLRVELREVENRGAVALEELRNVKVYYDGLVKEKVSVERKMDLVLREKDLIESNLIESNGIVDELKRDIKKISEEKMVVEQERDLLERKKNELQDSVDGLNKSVHKLQQGKTELVKEVAELEKKCVVSGDKEVELSAKVDILVKEKQEIELDIEKLTQEKSLVMRDLGEALKNLRNQSLSVNRLAKEKTEINDAKNQAESNIFRFKEQLEELKNTVKTLEKLSLLQNDKIKELESEKSQHVAALDQATKEQNSARKSLDGEKQKVKHLSENILKMEKDIEDLQQKLSKMKKDTEKLVGEKKDLEKTRAVLENDILVVKKSLSKTQKEHNETKGKLRQSESNTSKILKVLKNTSLVCNSKEDDKKGVNQETESGEEIKHHLREVEAIKNAFKDKESITDEMKKQLELLKVRVAKADKGKSFWTMVSSATTMLAALSLAYVARGGY